METWTHTTQSAEKLLPFRASEVGNQSHKLAVVVCWYIHTYVHTCAQWACIYMHVHIFTHVYTEDHRCVCTGVYVHTLYIYYIYTVFYLCVSMYVYCLLSHFSHVQLFVMLWTVAHQAPLSMGFSRQERWSGLPFPSPGDLPGPGIDPAPLTSLTLAGRFFTTSTTLEVHICVCVSIYMLYIDTHILVYGSIYT